MALLAHGSKKAGISASNALLKPYTAIRANSTNPIYNLGPVRFVQRKWSQCFLEYPKGYDIKIHGPFYPFRYYGPKDLRFWQVKVKDLPAWLMRRDYSPIQVYHALRRNWHQMKLVIVEERNTGIRFVFIYFAILILSNVYAGHYYGNLHGQFNKFSS